MKYQGKRNLGIMGRRSERRDKKTGRDFTLDRLRYDISECGRPFNVVGAADSDLEVYWVY